VDERIQQLANSGLDSLMSSLESGHSQALTNYLKAMSRFHSYSWLNCLLIWLQNDQATLVNGYRSWNKFGRYVKKGEKGISILAPILYKPKQVVEVADPDQAISVMGFMPVHVYDILQTLGDPIPEIGKRTGDPGLYTAKLLEFAAGKGISVTESSNLQGALGLSRGSSIELLQGLPPAEKFGVLVHEVGHSMLHFGTDRNEKTKMLREVEAESIAFVVSEAIGLENSTASSDYIFLYDGDVHVLTSSLSTIRNASSEILKAIMV
jgi:hypothetical protein